MSAAANVLVVGAAGRMGRAIARLLSESAEPSLRLAAALDRPDCPDIGADMGTLAGTPPSGIPLAADFDAAVRDAAPAVAVDFSFHAASAALAPRIAAAGIPWVVGTTGLTPAEQDAVRAAAEKIPVVQAANMSVGINLLEALVRQAALALRGRGYDCEIVERHHRHKKDAPSGTALFLGKAAAESYGWSLPDVATDGRSGLVGERPERQIGFHAVRGGDFVGDHTVLFAADGECLELTHRATSRDTLALGAIRAAAWLAAGRTPGLYGMADVLGLETSR